MKTRDALHCVLHLAVLLGWLSAAGAAENLPCTTLPNLQRMECEHQARQAERPAPVPPPPPSLRMEGPSGEVYNPLIAFCGTPAGGVERWERCVHAYMEEHQRAAEAAAREARERQGDAEAAKRAADELRRQWEEEQPKERWWCPKSRLGLGCP